MPLRTENFTHGKTESNRVVVFPNMSGSSVETEWDTPPTGTPIRTASAVGNEPYKNDEYFATGKGKDYGIDKLVNFIKDPSNFGKLPPVIDTRHPEDPSKSLILDGNHRTFAHKQAGAPLIMSHPFTHDQVHLSVNDYDPNSSTHETVPLSALREEDGSYNMDKEHPQLKGRTLRSYFASAGDS